MSAYIYITKMQFMSVSFEMKSAVQWASRNLHRFDRRWKKCEREMWRSWRRNAQEASPDKRCPLKATAVWCYLCFPLTSSADLTSRLCPSSVHLSFFFYTFCRLCIFLKTLLPSSYDYPISLFLSFHPLPISSAPQTLCLTGAPITLPRVHHHSISQ